MNLKGKQEKLQSLKEKMQADDSLPLRSSATNLVFGEGNPDAEIVFIGEGPGYWEDVKGRPFVGNARAFLNQLLVQAKIEREDVFITNVVNFRPPGNRDPTPQEIEAFASYIDKMIEIIDPSVIVTLGRFSMAKFIPASYISSVHGKPKKIDWKGKDITVVPMYHPAAGLRNPAIKDILKRDFGKLPEIVESLGSSRQSPEKEEAKSEQMTLV